MCVHACVYVSVPAAGAASAAALDAFQVLCCRTAVVQRGGICYLNR